MNTFTHRYNPDQLPPDELSEQEKQLLQNYLDHERAAKWRKIAGRPPFGAKAFLWKFRWPLALAILLSLFGIAWKAGLFSAMPAPQPLMAARTDLVPYPFDNIVVRGENTTQKLARTALALEAYNHNDFKLAIQYADANDYFFQGVCWLQLHQPQKAIEAFEKVNPLATKVGDEYFYYKGVAWQELGRDDEAAQAFKRVLDSKTVREPFLSQTSKRARE